MSSAVVFDRYGGPDVLSVVDLEPPLPGPGQLRVAVRAAGVQPFDALFRSGAARQWVPAQFPQRLGNDFAGVVDLLGPGTTAFTPGDEVLGWAMLAAYSEHVVVGVQDVAAKPSTMPWAEAGALSASGQTAATALSALGVGEGDTVVIHAAAGGVGSMATQIAVARGARVIGTASERNHDYLRSLGAEPVAYGNGLVERLVAVARDQVDAALDASGTVEALHASLAVVRNRDRVATVAFQPAADALGVRRLSSHRSAEQLRELTALYEAGRLRVTVSGSYSFSRAAAAHHLVETGHVRGKIVLVP